MNISDGAAIIIGNVNLLGGVCAYLVRRYVKQNDDRFDWTRKQFTSYGEEQSRRHAENRKAIDHLDTRIGDRFNEQNSALATTQQALAVIVAEFKPTAELVHRMDRKVDSLSESNAVLATIIEGHQRWIDTQSHPAMMNQSPQRPLPRLP